MNQNSIRKTSVVPQGYALMQGCATRQAHNGTGPPQ